MGKSQIFTVLQAQKSRKLRRAIRRYRQGIFLGSGSKCKYYNNAHSSKSCKLGFVHLAKMPPKKEFHTRAEPLRAEPKSKGHKASKNDSMLQVTKARREV